jgi:hypothetical protein
VLSTTLPVSCLGVKLGIVHLERNISRGFSRKRCLGKHLGLKGSNRRKLRNEELCGFNRHQILRAVKRDEKFGSCSTRGGENKCILGFWWGKPEGKRSVGIPRRRWDLESSKFVRNVCDQINVMGSCGLRFYHAFSSVVRQMPGYNSQRWDTAHTLPIRR